MRADRFCIISFKAIGYIRRRLFCILSNKFEMKIKIEPSLPLPYMLPTTSESPLIKRNELKEVKLNISGIFIET